MPKILFTLFPLQKKKLSVLTLYKYIAQEFSVERNVVYFSGPLSSGGAKSIYLSPPKEELDSVDYIPLVIKHNALFFEAVALETRLFFSREQQVTLPHHLGNRIGWKEWDYLRFWMYYLSGVSFHWVKSFEHSLAKNSDIDRSVFNNYLAPRQQRFREYMKLLNIFIHFMREQGVECKPISRMLLMPDSEQSLGSRFEYELARQMKIEIQKIYFDSAHPRFITRMTKISPWLINYPAQNSAVIASNGHQLIHLRNL